MERNYKLKMNNPKCGAGFFSKLFFLWIVPTFRKISKQGLCLSDLCQVLDSDNSEQITNKLEKNWEREMLEARQKNRNPSLINAISATFFREYMVYGIMLFLQHVFLRTAQPIVSGYLISLFDLTGDNQTDMYSAATTLVSISLVVVFSMHHINLGQTSIGMRVRVSVSSLIYRKTLRLGRKSLNRTSSGQIVNLLANDLSRFDLVVIALHYIWILPFQVAVITFLCWRQIGLSALVGVAAIIVLTLPLQGFLAKLTSSFRTKVAEKCDNRVTLMSEIISGIQVIKMYAWEKAFKKFVNSARFQEMKAISTSSYLRGVYHSFMLFVERTALFLTLTCYVVSGNTFVAQQVFSVSQFFNLLQLTMTVFYPLAMIWGAETLVSVTRLESVLAEEEKHPQFVETDSQKGVSFNDVYASWSSNFYLNDLTFEVPKGSLCAIVGPVGSGKSSILEMILNELKPNIGTIHIQGLPLSYAPQEPWLFPSTIRENILFGSKYDKTRYRKVIKVCALEKDFQQFPRSDKTIVGDRGATLSGGQKARINLARAVYRNVDIYLLDDPLSAVDSHVGKHLFEECIMKHLNGKTRILVTHQLQYLEKADHIIVLKNGRIEVQGPYKTVCKNKFFAKASNENEEYLECDEDDALTQSDNFMLESIETNAGITEAEEKGMIQGSRTLLRYITASKNTCLLVTVCVVLVLSQALGSCSDYWVTFWTQQEAARNQTNTFNKSITDPYTNTANFHHNSYQFVDASYSYNITGEKNVPQEITVSADNAIIDTHIAIYIYLGLVGSLIIFVFARSVLYFKLATSISKSLHDRILNNFLGASMKFFNNNSAGRILNRFSKDMGAVDEILPIVLLETISIALTVCGTLILVVYSNYYMVPVIIVLGLFFLNIRTWFIVVTKHVKHMEGTAKSPVFSHLSSSFQGITTIRAFNAEENLQKQFDQYQDIHTSVWFLLLTASASFGLWLDLVCIVFIALTSYSFIFLHQNNQVSGSLVGLAISQSLVLTGMLQFGVRQNAEVVNQLTSVERILQYDEIDKDGPFVTPKEHIPPSSWPNRGFLLMDNVSLRYASNKPAVLKNLHVEIQAGEKIGIVGRTGAGKSSLISALFRLSETSGTIYIDGVDTKTIGVGDLRRKISIIPQDPVLFSTTIRQNLDPFDEFADHDIWNVLEQVKLTQVVKSLNAQVERSGSNFSVGQRQLVCLARAMLKNNKILVMDEATANTDDQTDAFIQDMIRKKFKKCTVLTIAHRLHTVMDSDKIMVIVNGEIVDYNHPYLLLEDTNTTFFKMVSETGLRNSNCLEDIAFHAFAAQSARI